ncbi:MAG: hypothetical protein HOP13_13465 [Alphaproteobacteria bacterium]|nr:hypothetical protein [Alphaproteobacteria bacterium]
MALKGLKSTDFVHLESIREFPIISATYKGKDLGKSSYPILDDAMLGKRFSFEARITVSEEPPVVSGGAVRVFYNFRGKDGQSLSGVDGDALNDFQRKFLNAHCWDDSIPLCDGTVYVEFMKDLTGSFTQAELVGADLSTASVADVEAALVK